MYITINSIKKTLGKYVELTDLFIAVPSLLIFIVLFTISPLRKIGLIFIAIILFLMLPINLSKKNRMYKVMILFFKYIFRIKEFIYTKENRGNNAK